MVESDFPRWTADNERLLRAGLTPTGPGPFDHDEETVEAVHDRCKQRFGERFGGTYFGGLIATFPERNKELFPELFDENGNPYV